ncbi:fused MFS/spermidine synthase [Patescibacteria group bacterium]|nr:fused MFS/spermidine synthase [Patescibacteria group bacterium]
MAPLALYLISFMVAYRGRGGVRSPVWAVVVGVVTMITLSLLLNPLTIAGGILIKGLVCGAGFLLICFWFHRQLYEQRPATQYLGQYYTLVTIGGVVGSVIVTFILPLALNTRPELFISLVGIALYCLWQGRNVLVGYFGPRVSVAVVVLSMAILLVQSLLAMGAGAVARERNFYGVLRVVDSETYVGEEVVKMRALVSGSTLHGAEALDKEWQDRLLSYYSMSSGLGLLMQSVAERDERPRVAGVGLGVGVLNYYCEDLEQLDYIEINPAVYTLAQEYFTFLDRCPNHSGVTLGDGRTNLEAWSRAGREYDMVIIDAFTDDAIPLHLLTTEAFERAYLPLLSQNGVLAFHVTNRHLELTPVVAGAAAQQGLHTLEIRSDEVKEGERAYRTTWVLIGTKQALAPLVNQGYELYGGKTILWTDTKSSILEVLDF